MKAGVSDDDRQRERQMKIYIVRHGETEMNKSGVLQGWTNSPLNESGVLLAKLTGQAMRDIHFDRCISSPLVRARDTAEIILRESGNGAVPVEIDERLKEISVGVYEGRLAKEGPLPNGEAGRFFSDPAHFAGFPGGETIGQVIERTGAFLRDLIAADDGKTYLIGTHGCAVRALLNPFYEDPSAFWQEHVPYNCAVNILYAEGGKARLVERDKIYYDASYIVDRYAGQQAAK